MPPTSKSGALAPFRVRSFRFQWPADLLVSWAFEMEILILGWYILVETNSVLALTVFGSLQFLGTLVAPMLGVLADRLGRRTVLCAMRFAFAITAGSILALSLTDLLTPVHVFAVATVVGLIRPSDLVMRNALIGDTMGPERLTAAMGISRTTLDSARIGGALIGAGLFSTLGLSAAYTVVVVFYTASLLLTFGVSGIRVGQARTSPWNELCTGLGYVWTTPAILAAMWVAFLANLTVFPISHGILPYVAREVYMVDENGLGQLMASYACGALAGSIAMTLIARRRNPGQFMLITLWMMHAALLGFGLAETKLAGQGFLFLVGLAQSLSMISLAVLLLNVADSHHRGLVMGVRMLAVYGLPVGLLIAGVAIERIGFPLTVTLYSLTGIALSIAIAVHWRQVIWHAP